MARFLVTLYLSSNRECARTREVKRADRERAIFFAEDWLHNSRMSTRILWQWYDRYAVEEVNSDGEKEEIANGAGQSKDCYVAGYRGKGRRTASGLARHSPPDNGAGKAAKGKAADLQPGYLPIRTIGKRKGTRAGKELSPYQQKMRAAVEAAQERARLNGHVSRMGSNTHD